MKKLKVISIFGTRPEAIKMAPVVKELVERSSTFESKVCLTGQHQQMVSPIMETFGIKEEYNLNIMKPNQNLFDITISVLQKIQDVLDEFKPDIALVHGDTTTSFAATLACFYKGIKVGHVEAGLRTYDLQSPWPEEANRQLTDRIADYYFVPTEASRLALLNEGAKKERIVVTGNTVIDALLEMVDKLKTKTIELNGYSINKNRKIVLITGHRRENFGEGFLNICLAIKELANKFSDCDFVYPVHLNPNVQKPVKDILNNIENIHLIAPLDYEQFIFLMNTCHLILTDSGGIQEEAPSLGKPVLVMRNTTERPEAVNSGVAKLVGTDKEKIICEVNALLSDSALYKKMSQSKNPYGDGLAAKRIVDFLEEKLKEGCI